MAFRIDEGTIDRPVASEYRDGRRDATWGTELLEACTHYRVLDHYGCARHSWNWCSRPAASTRSGFTWRRSATRSWATASRPQTRQRTAHRSAVAGVAAGVPTPAARPPHRGGGAPAARLQEGNEAARRSEEMTRGPVFRYPVCGGRQRQTADGRRERNPDETLARVRFAAPGTLSLYR